METEVRLLVDDVVFRRRGDVRGLFSARRGYVNSELAALYGVDAPGATRATFVPVHFGPETPRAGLLTSGAFLTMNAHPTETSPTLRGKFVRERVLCQEVPPPPPNIDLDLARQEGEAPRRGGPVTADEGRDVRGGCGAAGEGGVKFSTGLGARTFRQRLTPLRRRVLELIWNSHLPVKAYELLSQLAQERAQAAPPTVYRALEFLQDAGLVHRIASLNAFVGCGEPLAGHVSQFLICTLLQS
jgi:hypothetical protein